MFVAADAAENNVILLSSLKGVNAGNLDVFVQLFLEGTIELHVGDNV